MRYTQEDLSSMETAKELAQEVLDAMKYKHRHKAYMGGCEECKIMSKIKQAIEELEAVKK